MAFSRQRRQAEKTCGTLIRRVRAILRKIGEDKLVFAAILVLFGVLMLFFIFAVTFRYYD